MLSAMTWNAAKREALEAALCCKGVNRTSMARGCNTDTRNSAIFGDEDAI